MARSLDDCPLCSGGTLVAYKTRRMTESISRRYLRCDNADCTFRGFEMVAPARRRKSSNTMLLDSAPQLEKTQ